MEWREKNLLPEECQCCTEEECYNCDIAGLRWELSQEDLLRARHKLLTAAMKRLQQRIAVIDEELERLEKGMG